MDRTELTRIAEEALTEGDSTLADDLQAVLSAVETAIRDDERARIAGWLTTWTLAEYGSRRYGLASALRQVATRIDLGYHRIGKV
jgi:hypothetical protein